MFFKGKDIMRSPEGLVLIHTLYHYIVVTTRDRVEADHHFNKDAFIEAWAQGKVFLFFGEEAQELINLYLQEQAKVKAYTT